MSKEEYMERLAKEIVENQGCFPKTIGYGCMFVLLIFFLASCSPKTITEYIDRDVNHYITNVVHDTLKVKERDSIWHEVRVVNDTVYDTKYVEKTKFRDRIVERHDTCFRDSVVTDYKETVKAVVKYPKTYWFAVGISVLFFIIAIIKFVRWLKMF